ncbi:MAG: helix-turn-helix transcriptional regulator [Clostridia bacterium]|nr:helix-turn-helix transcriptional regulator [Clostridia bacterium]
MNHSDQITAAICYIHAHLKDEDLSVHRVAEHCGLSADHFNRLFWEHTGFTMMAYIRYLRLNWRARVYLRNRPSMSILQIALECGYSSAESFSRAFKKEYGISPSEYRERAVLEPMLHADFGLNATLGQRLSKAYPAFHQAKLEQAVDALLKKDATRYGYDAMRLEYLGGAVMTKGDLGEEFLWCTEHDGKLEWATVFADDYDTVADYVKTFSDRASAFSFFTLDDKATVKRELEARGVFLETLERAPRRVCQKAPDLPLPEGYTVKRLHPVKDRAVYEEYLEALGASDGAKENYYSCLELKSELHYGIFKDGRIAGQVQGCITQVGDLQINTELGVPLLYGLRNDALEKAALCFVAADLCKQGIIPYAFSYFDCGITPEGFYPIDEQFNIIPFDEEAENQNARALGYETVNMKYTVTLF